MSDESAARTAAPAAVRTPSGARPVPGPVDPAPPASAAFRSVWFPRLVMVAVVLAALNLRPAITGLGALLEEVRAGLGMSGAVAGVLTSVPAVTFAVFGIAAPRLARRHGPAAVVCAGMAAIAAGLLIRPYAGGTPGFVAATALALIGIAVSNVLMPVIVKRYFPDRVGTMTGLYSMSLAIGTSVAAAATVPLTGALGGEWRTGLAVWGLLAVAAVLPWVLVVRSRGRHPDTAPVPAASAAPDSAPAAGRPAGSIVRSPTAWALAGFFGLQATGAYITMGWLPQIFRDAGVPASTAGVLLAVTMVMGVPLAFVIPRLAARFRTQGPIAAVLGLSGLAGYTGLLLAPAEGAWAWALLLGLSNCAFPLALTMIGMRSRSAAGTVRLSAFAQSTGYLISIPGPLLVGVLYEHTGSWGLPVALMAGLLVPQIVLGTLAGRDRTIEDETGMRD
ncbi:MULTISPECIES: CynX/NimT family MFS transporter [Streptomyces]|uniref:CynX/NimT family MFS transporter n=1 Tax=Streptomyces tsukubensis (strain DSM 42081 / NBRC 108919 / NRRL 18488 / 9993) TaxID=1114943 RepID=I2MW51_STRT9|nr:MULTISPECIES: MFS transporter [Streptomyces]AZK93433.1 cyanate MFS transporter [Streptomyces tsukubensis]EIF88998.1 integral membrane transporter [Streptomyces tsukubensis NRRL18488]MYS66233.1 CynX/NimT family MFS transporter [Streptomyces sp. SID5473]QKM70412.1 CynX/NimT family MFS transporter [Streptomyces tsukubensis NRRL18488]TAI45601.1 CynX/NimT family MFS transporter [Streptomyces tsukubensis]